MTTCILITNLSGVDIGPVRTWAKALLLEDNGPPGRDRTFNGPRYRARGFGVEGGAAVFTIAVPGIDHVFEKDPIPDVATRLGGTVLSTHGTLRIVNPDCYYSSNGAAQHADDYEPCSCIVMHLDCESQDGRAIDFERFESDAIDRLYTNLWKRLHAKCCHYHQAPYISVRSQVEIGLARRATRDDLAAGNPFLILKPLGAQ